MENNQRGRILFLTTSNLATNPRLVKELTLAHNEGYATQVICPDFDNWSKALNDRIVGELNKVSTIHTINAGKKPLLPWLYCTILESAAAIFRKVGMGVLVQGIFNKRTVLLLQGFKKLKGQSFDLVVAHNPGALYPASKYSKKHNIPFGFDVEDYHPGETNYQKESERVRKLLKCYLLDAVYISGASPLILNYTLSDLTDYNGATAVINNYFSKTEFLHPNSEITGKLKLVWFSQNIDRGRGLEQLLPAISKFRDQIELHLFGNIKKEFFEVYIKGQQGIILHDPLPQKDLHGILSEYDVGLAIEPAKDLNNKLAVSNKINAYIQSGLFIMASDTPAQRKVLEDLPGAGLVVDLFNTPLIEDTIKGLVDNKDHIRSKRMERFFQHTHLSWETESEKLLQLWQLACKKKS